MFKNEMESHGAVFLTIQLRIDLIMPYESQKKVVMIFPANGTVFVFFGADPPVAVHCFHKQSRHTSETLFDCA